MNGAAAVQRLASTPLVDPRGTPYPAAPDDMQNQRLFRTYASARPAACRQ
jgi:hypothetical protein